MYVSTHTDEVNTKSETKCFNKSMAINIKQQKTLSYLEYSMDLPIPSYHPGVKTYFQLMDSQFVILNLPCSLQIKLTMNPTLFTSNKQTTYRDTGCNKERWICVPASFRGLKQQQIEKLRSSGP